VIFHAGAWRRGVAAPGLNSLEVTQAYEFSLMSMGVLAPNLHMLHGSGRPPIDMSGNFAMHMYAKSAGGRGVHFALNQFKVMRSRSV
jgi:hypothetical protein